MTCNECHGYYEEKQGHLKIRDKYIGSFEVKNVFYLKCSNCSDYAFPPETSRKIEEQKAKVLDRLIRKHSFDEFIDASKAASILKMTRQGLHKNRRIRRGFIFQTRKGGKIHYLKKSVELYKQKKDGRFPLVTLNLTGKAKNYLPHVEIYIQSSYKDETTSKEPGVEFPYIDGATIPTKETYYAH